MDQIAFDTTFLIDLQNERRNVLEFRRIPGLRVIDYGR